MTFDFANEIMNFIQKCEFYLKPWAIVIGILWCINIFNWIIGSRLNAFSIIPRRPSHLIGIIISPFLHANFNHLFFNSIPLFILGLAILAREGTLTFCLITLFIVLLGGLGVWLFARKGRHLGASGLISGYFGYILMTAYHDTSVITVLLAIVGIYYFGSILLGLFPSNKQVSWEAHLFGFLAGVACVFVPKIFIGKS